MGGAVTAAALVAALRDPAGVLALDAAGWTALVAIARAEQLEGQLAHRLTGLALPQVAERWREDAIAAAEHARVTALWEAAVALDALAPLGVPLVLLKGTAYAAAGLSPAVGRTIGDLDILVPHDALGAVEAALLANGWALLKDDAYDDAYYRRWMHELPPLVRVESGRLIDVHHTILPPTARPTPNAAAMLADAVPLGGGWSVLGREDMVIHSAAHLFADGDLAGGLRNLWDIHRLLEEFDDQQPGFFLGLYERAHEHELLPTVSRAARLASYIYGTSVVAYRTPIRVSMDLRPSDRLYVRRLLARDGWGREVRPATRLGFYIRSHWLRMPPLMLARHLWTKARRR